MLFRSAIVCRGEIIALRSSRRIETERRGVGSRFGRVGNRHCGIDIVTRLTIGEITRRAKIVLVPVFKANVFLAETHIHRVYTTVTVLRHYKLGQSAYIVALGIDTATLIILRTVYEAYNIGILLDSTRFTKVGELRPLVLVATVFELSVELRKSDNRNIEFLDRKSVV